MASVSLPEEKSGLRARIGRFFYAEELPYGIAVVRMLLPIGLLVAMVPRWFHARELYSSDGATTPLAHAYGFPNMLPEFSGVVAVGLATLLLFTLVTMCIGWCTRLSVVLTFFVYTYLNLTDAVSTMTKYSVIASHVLLLLSMSQCGAVWSVDRWLERRRRAKAGDSSPLPVPRSAAWPRRLLQLLVGFVYFGAAITKFHTPAYFTSDQLGTWMQTNVNFANPLGEWLTQFPSLLVLFAYFTVVWEIVFIFLCWRGTARTVVIGLGAMFHVMTTLTLGLIVFPMVCISVYFAFLNENDFRAIQTRLRQFGLWKTDHTVEAVSTNAGHGSRGGLPVRSLVAFAGFGVIVAATGIEAEYWLDPYGLRRPEGPYALKEIDPELVRTKYLRKSGPIKPVDMIASFETGTIIVGGEVFNPRRTFRIGEVMFVQAAVSPPHPDMYFDCSLHDADDQIVDSRTEPILRESRRCNFSYRLTDALEPGDYSLVLKRAGREILRRRISIRPPKNSASAN